MRLLGRKAIGTTHSGTDAYETRGIITFYDPKTKKYYIEGNCFMNNSMIYGFGDWFYRHQIDLVVDIIEMKQVS